MAKRILVVDDEPDVLAAISLVLGLRHYDVLTARNGAECLDLLDAQAVDLILLDVRMPMKDGWDVLRELGRRPSRPAPPVILLTAKTQPVDKMLGLRVFGAKDYITKPFAKQDLLNRVARALGQP